MKSAACLAVVLTAILWRGGSAQTPECRDSYLMEADIRYVGDAQQASINMKPDCEAACNLQRSCLGYGFNVNAECFLTLAPPGADANTSDVDFDYYYRQRTCLFTDEVTECNYDYLGLLGVNTGLRWHFGDSLDECLQACSGFQGQCVAIQFDTTDPAAPKCYLHFDVTDLDSAVTNGNRQVFVYQGCASADPCYWYYEQVLSSNAGGGSFAPGNVSQPTCRTSCDGMRECVAYEFNYDDLSCWVHENPNAAVGDSVQNVTHFMQRAKCDVTEDTSCDYRYFGLYIPSGTGVGVTANTVFACLSECSKLADTCYGITFNYETNSDCFLMQGATDFDSVAKATTGVLAFHRDQACMVPATTPTPTTPTTSIRTTVTTPTVTPTTQPPLCSSEYVFLENFKVNGGEYQAAFLTVDQCRQGCNADRLCVGFDINRVSDIQCWFSTDPTAVPVPGTGEDHYTKTYNCDGCGYAPYPEKDAAGGVFLGVLTSDEECLSQCTASPTCFGIQYLYNNDTCFHFRAALDVVTFTDLTDSTVWVQSTCRAFCSYNYQKYDNMKVAGGTFFGQVPLSTDCEAACDNTNECIGFDFVRDSLQCWLTLLPNAIEPVAPGEMVDHWAWEGVCPSGDPRNDCRFQLLGPYKPTAAGTEVTASTVEDCLFRCIEDTACTGMYFDDNGSKCFIYTDLAVWEAVEQAGSSVTGFTLEECTGDGMTTAETTAATTTTTRPTTTTPPTTPITSETTITTTTPTTTTTMSTTTPPTTTTPTTTTPTTTTPTTTTPTTTTPTTTTPTTTTPTTTTPTTTTPTTTVTTECPVTFTPFPGFHGLGGNPQTGVTTDQECRQRCIQNPSCYGIDLSTVGTRCWIHVDPNVASNLAPDSQVTFESINRCVTEPTTTTPTTTAAPGTGCTPVFDMLPSTKVPGGSFVSGVGSVESCGAACVEDFLCLGFDFNKDDTSCWLNVNLANDPIETTENVDHYLYRWECTGCTFEPFPDRNRPGSIVQANVPDEVTCVSLCADSATCVSADFDLSGQCWHSDNPNINIGTLTGSRHWSLLGCDGDTTSIPSTTPTTGPADACIDSYQEEPNAKVPGGMQTAGADSVLLCGDSCSADGTCTGFDFNFDANSCWLTLGEGGVLQDTTENVNHYNRTLNCGGCDYLAHPNMHASGGVPQPGLGGRDVCLNSCTQDGECHAADVVGTSGCYFHADFAVPIAPQDGTVHWKEIACDGVTGVTTPTTTPVTNPPGACVPDFEALPGFKVPGGTFDPANTFELCLVVCVDDRLCIGFDFTESNQCWLTFDKTTDPIETTEPVTHYLARWRCGDCYYAAFPDEHGFGADPVGPVASGLDCLLQCYEATTCRAADYTSGGACWLFDFLTTAGDRAPEVGTTHFVELQCGTGTTPTTTAPTTTSPTTTLPTTTAPTTTSSPTAGSTSSSTTAPPPDGCITDYELIPDSNVPGGELISGVNTLDGCILACEERYACTGHDLDSGNGCWLTIGAGTVQDANGVSHYNRRWRCAGCYFTPTPDTHGLGGQFQAGLSTAMDCAAACGATAGCMSFDFAGSACYFLDTIPELFEDVGTEHWDQGECPGTGGTTIGTTTPGSGSSTTQSAAACENLYDVTPNSKVSGGNFGGMLSVAQCQDLCSADDNCVGFDYQREIGECWLTPFTASEMVPSGAEPVDHYTRYWNCSGCWFSVHPQLSSTLGTQVASSDANMCVSQCSADATCQAAEFARPSSACFHHTTAPTSLTADPDSTYFELQQCEFGRPGQTVPPTQGCVDDYTSQNRQYSGGILAPGVILADECKVACNENANCTSLDFQNTDNTCWLFLNNVDPTSVGDSTTVVHYIRYRTCNGCWYRPYPNLQGIGAVAQTGVTGIDDCIAACTSSATCLSLDVTAAGVCWHHDTHKVGALQAGPGILHYDFFECASGSGTTTPRQGSSTTITPSRRQTTTRATTVAP